jgi:hypothetical protein
MCLCLLCVWVCACVIFIVSSCVNFFALSNTFSYSKLFHTHWANPLLRHAEGSLNQNLSLALWKEKECTRMSGVQWLLVLLNIAIQLIEGEKFIYKRTIRISPICVCVWSLLINFPSLICGIWVHCVALTLCLQFREWKVYCGCPSEPLQKWKSFMSISYCCIVSGVHETCHSLESW